MAATTNNQSSWVGLGWGYDPGFVERSYRSCVDSAAGTWGASNASTTSGELCWAGDIVTLSLAGTSYRLVKGADGRWRPESDGGLEVELLTSVANGDNDGEYWKVTDNNGTTYLFGTTTDSAWTVPVYGDHAGDPCHNPSFAASSCQQAWRWALRVVVDSSGNAATYSYATESNYYKPATAATAVLYTRAGNLTSIAYGLRADPTTGAIDANYPAGYQVLFTTTDRCSASNGCDLYRVSDWPDTPVDLRCASQGCSNNSPSFWSTKKLTTVTTQARVSGVWKTVDTYNLSHSYTPDTTVAQLWLDSITRTGFADTSSQPLPPVTFHGLAMANRVINYSGSAGTGPMMMRRVDAVTSETGRITTVTYDTSGMCRATDSNLAVGTLTATFTGSGSPRCFAVNYVREEGVNHVKVTKTDLFHIYPVSQISETDPSFADTTRLIRYNYLGSPRWALNDSDLLPSALRTYSQLRGYREVDTLTGSDQDEVTLAKTYYLLGAGGPIQNRAGEPLADDQPTLAGTPYQSETYLDDTTVAAVTMSTFTVVATTGQRNRPDGLAPLLSQIIKTATSTSWTYNRDGSHTQTRTEDTYDSLGNLIRSRATADGQTPICTSTSYTPNNDPAPPHNLLKIRNQPYEVTSYWSGDVCDPGPPPANRVVLAVRLNYDSQPQGTAGSRGLVTTKWAGNRVESDQVHYSKSDTTYDVMGRVLSVTTYSDSDDATTGRTTSTSYLPPIGAPTTQVTVTNPKNQISTTTLEPQRGNPTLVKTPLDVANGKSTTLSYDPLGRLTKVWKPGISTSGTPSLQYDYTVARTAPETVTARTLIDSGTGTYQATSTSISDSFGMVRQTQTESLSGTDTSASRLVTDTITDSHGWVVKSRPGWYTYGSPSATLVQPTNENQVAAVVTSTHDRLGRTTASSTWRGQTGGSTTSQLELLKTNRIWYDGHAMISLPASGTATAKVVDAKGQTVTQTQYAVPPVIDSGSGQLIAPGTVGLSSTYSYDPAGNKIGMSSAGVAWSWTYDLAGHVIAASDPDAGATTTTFDDLGQTLSTVSAKGASGTVSCVYDTLGRKTAAYAGTVGTSQLASWTYDAVGFPGLTHTAELFDSGHVYTTTYGYDPEGRVTSTSVNIPDSEGLLAGTYTTSLAYTLTGLPKSMTYPAKGGLPLEIVATNYDRLGRAVSTDGLVSYGQSTLYTPQGLVSQFTMRDSTVTQGWRYDPVTLDTTEALLYTNTLYQASDTKYLYDAAGKLMSSIESQDSVAIRRSCYQYDPLSRLTDAWTSTAACSTGPSSQVVSTTRVAPMWESWTFTERSQRLTQTLHSTTGGPDNITSYSYATTSHQLTAVSRGLEAVLDTPHYDAGGALTDRNVNSQPQSFTTNQSGQVASITTSAGTTKYVRAVDGTIFLRREPNQKTTLYLGETQYVLSGGGVVGTRTYSHAGKTTAERTVAADSDPVSGVTIVFTDGQGTATVSISMATMTGSRRYFDPYGNPLDLKVGTNPWKAPTGRGYLNKATTLAGLTDMGVREYDPTIGQFTSVDPVLVQEDPRTQNGYAYTANDPINSADPTGMRPPPDPVESGPTRAPAWEDIDKEARQIASDTIDFMGKVAEAAASIARDSSSRNQLKNAVVLTDAAYANPSIKKWVLDAVFRDVFGFRYDVDLKMWNTGRDSLQSNFGYNDFFENLGPILGMSLASMKITFQANGRDYALWIWKGQYGTGLTYGGEIGLYSRKVGADTCGQADCYDAVTGIEAIRSVQELLSGDQQLLANDTARYLDNGGKTYWNLAIKFQDEYKGKYTKENLTQRGTLYVENQEVYTAMYAALQKTSGIKVNKADSAAGGGMVWYSW